MDAERWQQVKKVLDAVTACPAGEREVLLEEECGADATLRAEVESFLDPGGEADDFIEAPLWSITEVAPGTEPVEAPGESPPESEAPSSHRRIGPYRVERLLGRGGMGTVFLAVREDDYEQRVALKLVSWGMDSEDILGRFYTERQILANLQHPGIARLLDGGTTEEGMPYFAMEYIEGEPIDVYCESRGLSLRQRLELFRKVCGVIHYAHQNLVVHRDLKPNNILVTEEGEPKLLDFGIAKLLQPDRTSSREGRGARRSARPAATMPGMGPMTPDYASPEQILNTPITTACDVYALGVLLYRLLTGQPPYHLRGKSYADVVNLICLNEPRKPSAVFGQTRTTWAGIPEVRKVSGPVDPGRKVEDRRLRRQLKGDLDAVVRKAMRKEPRHRYGSALELAEDIRRHLVGLPIVARQGTWFYLSGKFIRRHKLGLLVVALILGFAVSSTVLWRHALHGQEQAELERLRADQERDQAHRERKRAETINDFLIDTFKSANPDRTKGEDVTLREVLGRGREELTRELDAEPEVKAELLSTLGTVYNNLGLYQEAKEVKEEAIGLRRVYNPEDHRDLAVEINNLARALYSLGDYGGAERYYREAIAMYQRIRAPKGDIAVAMHNLGTILMQQGRYKAAETFHQDALDIRRELYSDEDPRVASSLNNLGVLYYTQGELRKAEEHLRVALEIRMQAFGPKHTKVAAVLNTLGQVVYAEGRFEEAKGYLEDSLAVRQELLGEDHVWVASTMKNLAAVLLVLGDAAEAEDLVEKALAILRSSKPPDDWTVAHAESVYGSCLAASGRFGEAESLLTRSYAVIRERKGENDIDTRDALARVIDLYDSWGKPEKAREYRSIERDLGSRERTEAEGG